LRNNIRDRDDKQWQRMGLDATTTVRGEVEEKNSTRMART
jgi:hypothetical protein|tara:strand:- start:3566 stop:3685 length:120 start_codon:yes stop_codon:yes gene_type:complete